MDLLKAFSEISYWNEEFYSDDKLNIERRLARFKNDLEVISVELEITEMEAFFLTAIFALQVEESDNILFPDVVEKLRFPKIEALRYYKAIEGLEQKGWIIKIVHDEESIENVRYHKKISVIPYFNEEYKLTKKAIDKIIKR